MILQNRLTTLSIMAVLLVVFSCVAVVPPAGALSGFKTYFNDPTGTSDRQRAIRDVLLEELNKADRGDLVRIATYTLDDERLVGRIVAAHERKVDIQVILDSHEVVGNPDVAMLKKELGTDIQKDSWVKVCSGSCRGRGSGVMHSKIYTFSNKNKVYIGSANLTRRAMYGQWNELVGFSNKGIYDYMGKLFAEMKLDKRAPVYAPFVSSNYTVNVYPRSITKTNDLLLKDMKKIQCKGVQGAAGQDGRTVVLASQYAMSGTRGEYLARKLVSLKRDGCVVRVALGGESSKAVRSILRTGGILQPSQGSEGGGVTATKPYNHEKWMAISGKFAGNPGANVVITGSMNWSFNEATRDNVTIKVLGDKAMFDPYVVRMNQLKTR